MIILIVLVSKTMINISLIITITIITTTLTLVAAWRDAIGGRGAGTGTPARPPTVGPGVTRRDATQLTLHP